MNGDTIAWFLVERASADAPDLTGGIANIPRGTVFATREEADTAADRASRDEQGRPNVIVAELVDRRTDREPEEEGPACPRTDPTSASAGRASVASTAGRPSSPAATRLG